MAVRTFVVIDTGSLELELSICEMFYKTGIQRIDHARHVIVLGRNTYSIDEISYELVEEMYRVLEEFVQIMKSYKVRDYRAYVTNAMREAYNHQIILNQIQARTGLAARIISNPEQRFTSYKATAAKAVEFNKIIQRGTAVTDVGFGNAQLSFLDKGSLVAIQNLPLGTLRVRGPLARIPATVGKHKQHMKETVNNELFISRKIYPKDREITNFAGIGENTLYTVNRPGLNTCGDKVDVATMNRPYERIYQMTVDQIEERFGVNSEYASLFLPGVVVYKRTLELTGTEMFWVPGIHLYDGVVAGYANKNKLVRFSHNFENDILATSRNIAKRYKYHAGHNQVLKQYALDIFGNMKKFRRLRRQKRLALQVAVLFHTCGKFVGIRDFSERPYNVIVPTEIVDLNHLEREIIASVVRYNIHDFDYDKVQLETQVYRKENAEMSRNVITILIVKLTAILRLASSMGHSHRGKLVGYRMVIRENRLATATGYPGNMALKVISSERKMDFFGEIFGIRLIPRQKRRMQIWQNRLENFRHLNPRQKKLKQRKIERRNLTH